MTIETFLDQFSPATLAAMTLAAVLFPVGLFVWCWFCFCDAQGNDE